MVRTQAGNLKRIPLHLGELGLFRKSLCELVPVLVAPVGQLDASFGLSSAHVFPLQAN
eukprot:CAMPEP_0119324450 /NCGR_PEP_ID=MMETSP1333-20130426/63251_1 /TAXON_ID=418940 /ORGANISM="Scyphosphaera apsteinii, Strain RCC1455" /LENGTH=57 /DNA_ID=CAMNT_0007332151 /DNA_START=170 /DNA_END=343 /DNA_ORIENTATION=-